MPTPDQLHEINLKRLEHEYGSERQRIEFVQQFAHSGLRLIVLLNGGALVALFTLLGNLDKPAVDALALDEAALRAAFTWLVSGLAAACVAHLIAYITQEAFTGAYVSDAASTYVSLRDGREAPRNSERWFRSGFWLSVAAILAVVASVVCFCLGSIAALSASQPSREPMPEVTSAGHPNNRPIPQVREVIPEPAAGTLTTVPSR